MKDKKVLVVGLGRSGIAAMEALHDAGAAVYVQDSKEEKDIKAETLEYIKKNGITGFFGTVPEEDFDTVVLSPGVPPAVPFVQKLKENGAEIIGELELAYRLGHGTYIAITGTNGKTTTTTLVGEIFKDAYDHTYVVGNIGVAVISKSVEAEDDAWLVTECSSFQLETIDTFKPAVAAILNLTPDHLNRHGDMAGYGAAKARVFENMEEGYVIVNYDDKLCFSLCDGAKAKVVPFSRKEKLPFGAYLDGDTLLLNDGKEIIKICDRSELKIIGDHNVENVLSAAAISYFAGISMEVISECIRNFGGVEHRIEFVKNINGTNYYNDSKGTNTDATITAIRAIRENILLLAGGDAKKQDFAPLAECFDGAVKHVFLYGRDAGDIKKAMDDIGYSAYTECTDLPDAVSRAYEMASSGDSVLLSPACASWDAYPNFEIRGEHFKELVGKLEG